MKTGATVCFTCDGEPEALWPFGSEARQFSGLKWAKKTSSRSLAHWQDEWENRVYVNRSSVEYYSLPTSAGTKLQLVGSALTFYFMSKSLSKDIPVGTEVTLKLGEAKTADQLSSEDIRSFATSDDPTWNAKLLIWRPVTSVKYTLDGQETFWEQKDDELSASSSARLRKPDKGYGSKTAESNASQSNYVEDSNDLGDVSIVYFYSQEVPDQSSCDQAQVPALMIDL